ncbi:MAG: PD-(D/E)XK nuclease family protein [Nonlabens sp.]
MDAIKLQSLLNDTKEIVRKHEKAVRDKGEDFNIFSLLGMESNETKTHSGMLVALLNPKGDHYQGATFLKLFLEEIDYNYEFEDLDGALVKAEHHLGKISNDYLKGGYIDILITFPSGKAIAIENKIQAGDQLNQMYRYSLYKKDHCKLYYLNLFGDKPSQLSLHTLNDDDYGIITYKDNVVEWLEKCMSVLDVSSIIHGSIKQYYILIKKLTDTMDDDLENILHDLIFDHIEESKHIHSHYLSAVELVCEKFKNAVFESIKTKLQSGLKVRLGNQVTYCYSQIWIDGAKYKGQNLLYGIESFATPNHGNGKIFVGIVDKENREIIPEGTDSRLNSTWAVSRYIKINDHSNLDIADLNTLARLYKDQEFFKSMVDNVVSQSVAFIIEYQTHLKKQKTDHA